MFWNFTYNNEKYVSWGSPRSLSEDQITDLSADFSVPVYNGAMISPEESIGFFMQGDATLGLGDSIWLITFMRQIYRIKARRRAKFLFYSGDSILNFYSLFTPSSWMLKREYCTREEFDQITYKLPALYYWHEQDQSKNRSDKSWVDNRSLLQRLYSWTGLEYEGLPDWGEFTKDEILYPSDGFWNHFGLNPKDKYVFFQWHSSGHSKNLSPAANVKLIKHIIKKYGYKVYVVGRLNSLDSLNSIPGCVSLSGKTEGRVLSLFSLAFNSEFIVCPDSAGVHLGEAYRVPTVCIMSTLPPSYIASKYKIPAFMYGSGKCGYKPCGVVHELPRHKCPEGTGDYCQVVTDVDLDLFDRCVETTMKNRIKYGSCESENFYAAMNTPIVLG